MWQCRSSNVLIILLRTQSKAFVIQFIKVHIYGEILLIKTVPKGSLLNVSKKCISSM